MAGTARGKVIFHGSVRCPWTERGGVRPSVKDVTIAFDPAKAGALLEKVAFQRRVYGRGWVNLAEKAVVALDEGQGMPRPYVKIHETEAGGSIYFDPDRAFALAFYGPMGGAWHKGKSVVAKCFHITVEKGG